MQLDPAELNALYNLTVNLAQDGRGGEARAYGERFIASAPPALSADVAEIRRIIR